MTNKLTLDREKFVSKLSKAIAFIPKKTIVPQFDNFRFTVSDNLLEIVATDSNIELKLFCECEATANFSFCPPAALLLKTVSLFKENEVTIVQKSDRKIELKSGKSKYNISLDCFPETFTTMPMSPITSEINLSQFMCSLALKSAREFVDEKHPNVNMTAINITEINNKIIFTGLTRVLICRAAVKPISINAWETINIPTETAKRVIGLLSDKGEISMAHCKDKVQFFTESPDKFIVTATTANIVFPSEAVKKFFNEIPTGCLTVNTLELRDAIRRLSLYSSIGEEPSVHVSNVENTQELRLTSIDTVTEKDGEELISIINPKNVILDKKFNSETIIQLLSEIDAADTNIFFVEGDPKSPSFMIPKVSNEEEDIYSFMIASVV